MLYVTLYRVQRRYILAKQINFPVSCKERKRKENRNSDSNNKLQCTLYTIRVLSYKIQKYDLSCGL